MFRRRRKLHMPGLNTTATADISFMLLVFFLLTTSIDNNKGMLRSMAPPAEEEVQTELVVKKRNVLPVEIDEMGNLTCNGKATDYEQLKAETIAFIENIANQDSLPEISEKDIPLLGKCRISDKHVVLIKVAANTTYESYFKAYNNIIAAYSKLRGDMAMKHFGCKYSACTAAQREAIAACYPQRISDADIEEEKGGSK